MGTVSLKDRHILAPGGLDRTTQGDDLRIPIRTGADGSSKTLYLQLLSDNDLTQLLPGIVGTALRCGVMISHS